MRFNLFQKVALTTVVSTLLLIFIGGLVRASGAGLGCPDWPTCFGSWMPPTSAAELPAGYDASQFSVFKTWTEYLNRLVGVAIGLLITATFVLSFRYKDNDPPVFYSSAAAFLMVVLQGWLGGQVVLSGLSGWLITLHMLLAVGILNVLIFAVFKSIEIPLIINIEDKFKLWIFWSGVVLLGFTLVQMVLGTQVREAVDAVKQGVHALPRERWLANAGSLDEIHRTFSWTIALAGGVVFYICRWKIDSKPLEQLAFAIIGLILFQVMLGIGLYYLGMPPSYQVFHLFGFVLLVCVEFLLLLILKLPFDKPDKN